MTQYTVFVDGIEVNDYYLPLDLAREYERDYKIDGYEPYIHEVVFNDDGSVKEYLSIDDLIAN
jgi:hypothetical protein